MADSALIFVLENLLGKLKCLLPCHLDLVGVDAKNESEKLERELMLFKVFLKDSTAMRTKDECPRLMVRRIRDAFYEAEDIIDAFVTQAAAIRSKNYFLRTFQKPVNNFKFAKDFQTIGYKVRALYTDIRRLNVASLEIADGEPEEQVAPLLRKDNVVGFEDEVEKCIERLMEETQHLDVISIIGMPGLGKTTLAWKIFHDPTIQYEFPIRKWVCVSKQFKMRDVFLAILRECEVTDDIRFISDGDLAIMVSRYLGRAKFLIVMDDVWTAQDWDDIQIALPRSNTMGKVVITTHHENVARHANPYRLSHKLRFLTREESWLLLQLEVFGKPECPSDLEILGNRIAEQCDGLPLAVVVIGGILAEKVSAREEISARKNAWKKVSESVTTYLNEDPEGRMEKIISLSYDELPYHLRACFLYLGMFPENFDIPVWKLIRMWIAEGFIQERPHISLEENAENYLYDLIQRNLLRVDKRRANGEVKSCRIHGMLRNFCKNEARNERENFLQEVKRSSNGFEPPFSSVLKYHRLCIHSNVLNFVSSKPFGPHVRSFVCFSKEEITLPPENISAIPAAFKRLRVLEVKPIKFTIIPNDLYHLVHLRYITLSFNLAILPAAFSKLWNLQTLVVDTGSCTLEVKADIWKMVHLRHLKTNASAALPKTGNNSGGGENLQTLDTISPQSCTHEVFGRARNLKKLGIRGRLAMLLDSKNGGSFDKLSKLRNLENLTLLNDVFSIPASIGQLGSLPPPNSFPPNLRILTLSNTFLDWSHMTILGLLETLEVLKLKDKAFMGKSWEVADGGFRYLIVLHIGRTDLVDWVASAHHFPNLRCLELRNCEELQEVPIGLADISSLQLLNLYNSKLAAASAKKIHKTKLKPQEEGTSEISGFKLSIFPPDE